MGSPTPLPGTLPPLLPVPVSSWCRSVVALLPVDSVVRPLVVDSVVKPLVVSVVKPPVAASVDRVAASEDRVAASEALLVAAASVELVVDLDSPAELSDFQVATPTPTRTKKLSAPEGVL